MGSTITLGSGDDRNAIANIQREMLELAKQGSLAVGDMVDGFFDDYQGSTGIDSGLSTNYTYDGTGKKITPFEGSTGNTAYEDVTDVGISTGTALIQDIKASITTWTKDASTTGHFNTANTAVTVGCLITFADASTATIVAKTSDGTNANDITLSVDHATDAGLVSITGLIYSAPNVTVNAGQSAESSLAYDGSSQGNPAPNYSMLDTRALPNGKRITKINVNASGTFNTLKLYIYQDDGTNFIPTLLGTYNITSTGGQDCALATPFDVPASGTYYVGYYCANTPTGIQNQSGSAYIVYYFNADKSVSSVKATWSTVASRCMRFTYKYITYAVPTALFVAHSNSVQLNTALYSAITAVVSTQVTAGSSVVYHAASFNKGNAAEKWYVYLSSAWHTVAELVSGTWQYRDAGAALQNATINSRLGALAQAFGVTENKMNKAALDAITSGQWATPFVAGTFDMAAGLQASGVNIPTLDKWTVTYSLAPQNMSLVSAAVTGLLSTPTRAMISLLVKGGVTGLKAYFSSATSPSWTETTGLTKVAENIGGVSGVHQYVSTQLAVTGSADKAIRTKVEVNCSQSSELHAQAVNYGS